MRPHDRVDRRQAEPACGEHHRLVGPVAVQPAWLAERAGDAAKVFADLHPVDPDGARAHRLNDQIDRSCVSVPVGEGQRNEFALRRRQQTHELSGLRRPGDEGRMHGELDDAVRQFDLPENGLVRLAVIGVAPGALDAVLDFRFGERHVAHDLARRRLSVAGCANSGRAAARRVAARIDAIERGLLRSGVDADRPPFRGLKGGFGVLDDRVRRVAERHDDEIDRHRLGLARRDRRAPARRVGRPELHHVENSVADGRGFLADELARRSQHLERDAFLERMVEFLDPHRHLGLGAAIDDGDDAAEPFGGARGVHCGVAAANDDDLLVLDLRQRRFVVFEPRLHQVDAGKELVGGHHAEEMLSGYVHEARQARRRSRRRSSRTPRP